MNLARRYPVWLVLPAVAAAAAAAFLLWGNEERVLSLTNDDAYYYFQIARNVVHGNGVSFDGQTPTNGFHPLYLGVLLPIFSLGGGDDVLPIRLALVVLAMAYFATSFTIYGTVHRLSGPRAAGWASLAWAFNPTFIFFARGGVEVAIYTFVASLTIYYYVDRFRPAPTAGKAARLGILAGMTMLGRTDGVLLLAAIACDFLFRAAAEHAGWRRGATLVVAALLPAALLVTPWVAWNLNVFGSLMQTSARAHTFADSPERSLLSTVWALGTMRGGPAGWGIALGGLALSAWLIRILMTEWRDLARRLQGAGFLALYLAIFSAALAWYNWFRNWYFLAPSMSLVIVLATTMLPAGRARRRTGALILAALWSILAVAGTPKWTTQLMAGEGTRATIMADAGWIARHLPNDAVIGSFNAGRSGYFLPRQVVNLDGVVNNQAVDAFATRSLDRYLSDRGVTHVLDRRDYVRFYLDRYSPVGMSCLTFVEHLRVGDLYRFEPPPARHRRLVGAPDGRR